MSAGIVVLIVVIAVAVGALAAWFFFRRRHTARLRDSFGPEYHRTVTQTGKRKDAERELEHRQERVSQLDIRPLPPGEGERFARDWQQVQKRFVDEPPGAVNDADHLVTQLMQRRGYPMADFEQRAADLSVDHPRVVQNYRAGHALAARVRDGGASTEELRQAMVHYRTLFDDLLEEHHPQHGGGQ